MYVFHTVVSFKRLRPSSEKNFSKSYVEGKVESHLKMPTSQVIFPATINCPNSGMFNTSYVSGWNYRSNCSISPNTTFFMQAFKCLDLYVNLKDYLDQDFGFFNLNNVKVKVGLDYLINSGISLEKPGVFKLKFCLGDVILNTHYLVSIGWFMFDSKNMNTDVIKLIKVEAN